MSGKQKCFRVHGKNIYCFRAAKFVSATHVSRAAKLGNICIRNNVSAAMFPRLARPFKFIAFSCPFPSLIKLPIFAWKRST